MSRFTEMIGSISRQRAGRAGFIRELLAAGVVLALGAGVAAGTWWYSSRQESPRSGGGRRGGAASSSGIAVRVAEIRTGTLSRTANVVGVLEPHSRVTVHPRTSGLIEEVTFQVGDEVQAGDLLIRLDKDQLEWQLTQALADRAAVKASGSQAAAALAVAEADWRRIRALLSRGLASEQQGEAIQAAEQKARSQVEFEKARLEQAEARVQQARLELGYAHVLAPVSGTMELREAEQGALVTSTTRLAVIIRYDPMKLVVKVPESDVPRYVPGLTASVGVDAFPGRSFSGRVLRVFPSAEPATRLFPVELEVPNPLKTLKAGMFARVGTVLETRDEATLLPRTALVGGEVAGGVFVVEGDKAYHRSVTPVLESQSALAVSSGVHPGDRVVVLGHHLLSDGSLVRVVESSATASEATTAPAPARRSRRGGAASS